MDLLQVQAHYSRRSGHWRIGYAAAAEARDLADAFQHPWQAVYCLIELAWLDAAQGNEDSCRRHVDGAVALASERRMQLAVLRANHALGLLHLGTGQNAEAVERLYPMVRAVERLRTSYHNLDAVPDYLEVLWRMGSPPSADAGAELLSRCYTSDTDQDHALTERCRGMLADDGDFERHFRAAIEAHQTELEPFALARTQLLYGERLRRAQRRREAREQLRQALDAFDKLCAGPWVERARRELGATGAKVAPRPVSVDLTPQELQIALLVARARTIANGAPAMSKR